MPTGRRTRDAATLFLGVLTLYAFVFGARAWWLGLSRGVRLYTVKPVYLHYELVDVRLATRDPELRERWRQRTPRVTVLRDGRPVTTIAGAADLPLRQTEDSGVWLGRWPVPWNAPVGSYELRLEGNHDLGDRLDRRGFRIERRKPWPVPKGFAVVTLEGVMPLATMEVVAPDGTKKDWRGLLDWVQYVGADAFWMLGGQTPGAQPGQVWVDENFKLIPAVARECRRRGIKFGVYAMCYLTMSTDQVGGYKYALEVEDGHAVPTRAISLSDKARPRDVAALLKKFRDTPGVDFVGLDYIRNALGGYELVDDFYSEMSSVIHPPPEWPRMTEEQRMVWFARKKIMRKDEAFIDAWQWWRAHRVGEIVRGIKNELGDKAPLWAFTLTWDKGWQHGQDPVMMNDAGVDLDALMLYQADKAQFEALVRDFHRYVRRNDVQLVAGEIIDWGLHQRDPAGPKELYRRETEAIDEIYSDGPAKGVFFHDLGRALWGTRLGRWGTRGWLDEVKRSVRYFKSK